jgi:hypothetical protein
MSARVSLSCVTALALLSACSPPIQEATPTARELAGLLPPGASLAEWQTAEGPTEYSPETLYEYLDGGAPRYLTYGFRRLIHVRYRSAEDDLDGVTLDVFDMGTDSGAFGIYSSARPAEAAVRDWCAGGYRSGPVAAAWKGSLYVHAMADGEGPSVTGMMERLVGGVCDKVAGNPSRPSMLDALPTEGLVPHSERYVAEDLLGHSVLPGGVLATYMIEGGEAWLFFSDLGDESSVMEAVTELRAHHSRGGSIVRPAPSIGTGGFRFSGTTLGDGTVVGAGRFVAGIHGDPPHDAQERLLGRLVRRLAPASGS